MKKAVFQAASPARAMAWTDGALRGSASRRSQDPSNNVTNPQILPTLVCAYSPGTWKCKWNPPPWRAFVCFDI